MSNANPYILIILISGAIINLYFYLNITFNIILTPTLTETPTSKFYYLSSKFIIPISSILLFSIPIFILIYAMTILNQSQRHWNTLLHFRSLSRNTRRRHKTTNSNRTKTTRIIPRQRSTLQYYCNSSRLLNNLLPSYTSIYWRIWKLTPPINTRSTRHGLPTTKQYKVLTTSSITYTSSLFSSSGKGSWNRMNSLPSSSQKPSSRRPISRPSNLLPPSSRGIINSRSS